ncbi:MAG: hypothetical protein AAB467_03055 [Patescibacteria group bacterium]
MKKSDLLISATLVIVLVGFGCKQLGSPTAKNTEPGQSGAEPLVIDHDQFFENSNTKVSFQYKSYLQSDVSSVKPGAVTMSFTRRSGSLGLIDTLYFSTKTREAWLAEKAKLDPRQVCENYAMPGCEKWDEDVALYNRVVSTKNFGDYYALGFDTVTLAGIKFIVVVTFNPEREQYQTTYLAYANDTRITFVDPATGGLEYGVPFQMNAKNREAVESTGMRLAKREKIDDVKTRARADELYQIVSTVHLAK